MSTAVRLLRLTSRRTNAVHAVRRNATRSFHKSPIWKDSPSTASVPTPRGSDYTAALGGVAGGSLVLLLGYAWYHFSGAKAGVRTLSEAKAYLDSAAGSLKSSKEQLKPDETIQWLRSTTIAYAGLIPGGKGMMDKLFDGLEEVRRDHEGEVTEIMNEAYGDIRKLVNNGSLDVASAKKAWDVLEKAAGRLEKLVESAGVDMLEKHPELKEQYGQKLKQLKDMGNQQGGDAKKLADETYQKIKDAVAGGNISGIGDMVQEGMNKTQQMGDEALKAAFDKAKPYLDKSPELKQMLEQNYDQLKQQNMGTLVKRLQDAAQNGNVNDLKGWLEQQTQQLQGMGDQAWKGAMIRASIYLDKYPELKKVVEEKSDALKKVDFEELMNQLRKVRDTGDIKPAKDYIEREARRVNNA